MLRKLLFTRFMLHPAILSSAVFAFPSTIDGDYVYENFISLKLLAEMQEISWYRQNPSLHETYIIFR